MRSTTEEIFEMQRRGNVTEVSDTYGVTLKEAEIFIRLKPLWKAVVYLLEVSPVLMEVGN